MLDPQTPLDVADVLPLAHGAGRRHLDTGYGRIAADAGQAAAALEAMGGFALDPHWQRHLPPTMAPASTPAVDGSSTRRKRSPTARPV